MVKTFEERANDGIEAMYEAADTLKMDSINLIHLNSIIIKRLAEENIRLAEEEYGN